MPVPSPNDNLPDELWHYTTAGGLHGILQHNKLFATHAAYLNDSQEFLFGMKVVVEEMKRLAQNPPPELLEGWDPKLSPPMIKIMIQRASAALVVQFAIRSMFLRLNAGPYVSCLSAERDQLSQWRGYGVGGGYAIRFDPQALKASLDTYIPPVQPPPEETFGVPVAQRRLIKMEYEADAQTQIAREELVKFLKTIAATITTEPGDPNALKEQGTEMINPLLVALLDVATRLKHHGFKEENEYRIVTFMPPEFFSPNDIGLIPRVNIGFDPGCVKEILIGPGQHMDTRESSVRAYLQRPQGKYLGVEVNRSDTPFTGK